MNRIYKTVWNEQTGTYVAVPENTMGRGKRSSSFKMTVAGAALAAAGMSGAAMGQPLVVVGENSATVGSSPSVCSRTNAGETWTCSISTSDGGIATISGIPTVTDALGNEALDHDAIVDAMNQLGIKAIALGDINTRAGGENSIALGSSAQAGGIHGIAIGFEAGKDTTGDYNVALGGYAGQRVTGDRNTALGDEAGRTITGDRNVAVGDNAGNRIGVVSADASKNQANVAIGASAGNDVEGSSNTAIGTNAGRTVTGSNNIAVGNGVGRTVVGHNNVASGYFAGQNVTGSDNIASGFYAGQNVQGSTNIASGYYAGQNVTGNNNIGIGRNAGSNVTSTSGFNTAMGADAGWNVNGMGNTASGYAAGRNVTGNTNAALGASAGQYISGSNNVAIGYQAGRGTSSNSLLISNTVAVGNQAIARNNDGIAIGTRAESAGSNGLAIGSNATSDGGTALGARSATSNGGVAIGIGANAGNGSDLLVLGRSNNNVALGDDAWVLDDTNFNVALGALSIAGDASLADPAYVPAGASVVGLNPVGEVSVGSRSEGVQRRITNLAAGAADTDAVNVSQLKALAEVVDANSIEYFSVNSTGATNKDNTGATGTNAVAIGMSTAAGSRALAVGTSTANGNNAVAIGVSSATANQAIAVGQATAASQGAIAIGDMARISATNSRDSIALGRNSTVNSTEAIAMGGGATVNPSSTRAIALGQGATANGAGAIAMGGSASAGNSGAIAIGNNAISTASSSIAMGQSAAANSQHMVVIGGAAGSNGTTGQGHTIVGYTAGTGMQGQDNTAVGRNAMTNANPGSYIAPSENSAFGVNAGSHMIGVQNTVVGAYAGHLSEGRGNIYIGPYAGSGSSASARATGEYNVALGNEANRGQSVYQTVALGNLATVTIDGGVALGANSRATEAAGQPGYVFPSASDAQKAAIAATTSTWAGVSVGDAATGNFRQIHGVAAGTNDSDAVNVAQLRSTAEIANAGWFISAQGLNASNVGPNGQVDLHSTDGNIVISKTADNNNVSFDLARDIDVDSVTTGNTVMDTDGIRISDAGGTNMVTLNNQGLIIAGGPSITNIGINAGGMRITNVAAGIADTDAVNVSQLKDVQQGVDDLGDRAVKYDGNTGDPKTTITLEGAGGTTITNLADGSIAAGSTDAVNGGQIHDMGQSIADGMGGNSKFEDGKLITELNVAGNTYNNVNDALGGVHSDLSTQITEITEIANAGWNVQANSGPVSKVAPGSTVKFIDGQNINVTSDGLNITIATADDMTVNSITAVTVNAQTVAIENGPIIDSKGIDMAGKPITNVAAGVNETDAVNVGQLQQAAGNLQNQVNDLRRQDKRLSGGVAAAMATAALPQAYLPGKTMMSIAGGTWNSESGMAIGFSGISDNGHWVYKLSGNATSRGDYGGAIGVGYQW